MILPIRPSRAALFALSRVTASPRGLAIGEVARAPGVEEADMLDDVFKADLAAVAGRAPRLAQRPRAP